jgi:drug/metabolite transporter (DMT)-like permease
MSYSTFIRLGGLAAMVGGVLYAVVCILTQPFYGGFWEVSFVLFLLSVMAAIVALHLLQRERYGRKGTLASFSAFVCVALTLGGAILWELVEALLGGTNPLGLAGLYRLGVMTGALLAIVGMLVATVSIIALGRFTLEAGVMPWWCGAALIAGNPLFAFALFLWTPGGGAQYNLNWLIAVLWAVVGYAIFRAARRRTERPSRVR